LFARHEKEFVKHDFTDGQNLIKSFMKIRLTGNIKTVTIILTLIVLCFPFNSNNWLRAALIEPESILYQIIEKNKDVTGFYAEIRVGVYDPEAFSPLSEEANMNLKPYEITEKSFYQNIVYIRDEFFSVETADHTGQTLHIYIKEIGGAYISKNLSTNRLFSDEDVIFPYLTFFTKHVSLLEQELYQFEVVPNQLKYNHLKNSILYQVGSDTNYLLIDPNSFKVLELQRQIQIQGRYFPLTFKFGEWDPQKDAIPDVTRLYANTRLFKEIRIVSLQLNGVFTQRNSITKKYQRLFSSQAPYLVEMNYGQ
jgi:hypothetical protein